MHAQDYISDYEGREGEPEPEPLHCGSCGQPVPELTDCTWERDLMVGKCCRVHPDVCESCNRDHEDCRCFPLTFPADGSGLNARTVRAVPIKEVA
jgi:hypothetical protein